MPLMYNFLNSVVLSVILYIVKIMTLHLILWILELPRSLGVVNHWTGIWNMEW